MTRGHLFLLIGPSGSGKTTLIRAACARIPRLRFIPTTTTRPPRPGEQDGREYFFVRPEEFDRLIARGDLLEWQWVHQNRYGTSRSRFAEAIEGGVLGITSVDILGGIDVKSAFPEDSTAIFVRPTSLDTLRDRLIARGDTAGQDMDVRLSRVEMELQKAAFCDVTLINDDGRLQQAADELCDIVERYARG